MTTSLILVCVAVLSLMAAMYVAKTHTDNSIEEIRAKLDISENERRELMEDIKRTSDEFAERLASLENALDSSGIEDINKAFNDEFEKLMSYNVSAAYRAKE